jgi:hypothetical protein
MKRGYPFVLVIARSAKRDAVIHVVSFERIFCLYRVENPPHPDPLPLKGERAKNASAPPFSQGYEGK